MKLVTVKTRVREDKYKRLEEIAQRDEQSMADLLRRAVRELLERENGKVTA